MVYVDSRGIVCDSRKDLEAHKRDVALRSDDLAELAWPEPLPLELRDIVELSRPTVLIGTTGQPGDFTPGVIRTIAAHCARPIILPLSNPTTKAECTPSEVLQYSEGRALVATGSPFEPVEFGGSKRIIGQCNNVFVFPGVGLGVLISEAGRVTDSMFLAAAKALAEITQSYRAGELCLYPSLRELRQVSKRIAFKVTQKARDEGVGRALADDEIQRAIEEFCWNPAYEELALSLHSRGVKPTARAGSRAQI
jgi:malic enzyme